MAMECTAQHIANVVLIRVIGRIDHTTAKAFEETLSPYLDGCTGEAQKGLLDFSGVDYLSSAGLRVLMIAAKHCREQHGELVIAALQPMIQEVFRISRFDLLFPIFPTVQAALAAIAPAAAAVYDSQ
jgi:anti-anti-sigma factor